MDGNCSNQAKIDITLMRHIIVQLLYDLLADIVAIDNVLFIVKSDGATAEIRSNSLDIRKNGKWITIGSNEGPAHMHVNSEQIASAKFVKEKRLEKSSFSIRFFDDDDKRILAAFFAKMYDEYDNLIPWRRRQYEELDTKYAGSVNF